ncbi:MAG: hypothetical protein LBG19_08255 [Prevotellaceae bacterium]|jgi:hypothetical protein|nr:hypothetical protein [Prevotellaceae bacterium]
MKKLMILALLLCGVNLSSNAQRIIIPPPLHLYPATVVGNGMIYTNGSEIKTNCQYRVDLQLTNEGEVFRHGVIYIYKQNIQTGMGQLVKEQAFYSDGPTFFRT